MERTKTSYGEKQENVIVRLYGKTRDGKSVTVLCPDFKPYCHVFDPSPDVRENIAMDENVLSVEDIMLSYKGKPEKFLKVTLRAPWSINRLREAYELKHRTITLRSPPPELLEELANDKMVEKLVQVDEAAERIRVDTADRTYAQKITRKYGLLEYADDCDLEERTGKAVFFSADIRFTDRYIYDMNLDACVRVYGETLKTGEYTTDIAFKAFHFDTCEQFTPPLKILSFDIENSIKNKNLYCICLVLLDQRTGKTESREIASHYGYRGGNADDATRNAWDNEERAIIRAFVDTIREWDPDVITGYNINNYDLRVLSDRSRLLFPDEAKACEDAESKRRTPNSAILKIGRDDVGLSRRVNRTTGFVTWDVKGRIILDAWLGVKKELHPKRESLGYVSKMLFNDTKDNINSTRIDQEWKDRRPEVIKYCTKDADLAMRVLLDKRINSVEKLMDIAVPSKLPAKEVGGGQNRMIESLLIRMVDRAGVAVPMGNAGNRDDYEGGFVYPTKPGLWEWVIGLDFSSMYPSQIIKHNICFTTYTEDPTLAAHTSPPIGPGDRRSRFVAKETKPGIVPRMSQGLLDARKAAKANKKKAEAAGDKDLADYYDRLQAAIKVISNATYGYFGTQFCRWPYREYIAPSITAWAREEIGTVVNTLEDRGYTVVAGDTDSVMFKAKDQDGTYVNGIEACVKIGTTVQQEFSAGGMHLELEKVMERFFAHAKKRYFGKIVWPKPDLIVRGYEPRRTDSFDLQSETMTEVFNLVLDGKPEDAVAHAKDVITNTLKGRVPLEKLVISKTINDEDDYANPDSLMQVQVARKLVERGYDFTPGMKTPFIITNSEKTPMEAEPIIDDEKFEHKPDYKYYAQRVAASLARITESFDCDERMLMQGNSQKSLAKFFNTE